MSEELNAALIIDALKKESTDIKGEPYKRNLDGFKAGFWFRISTGKQTNENESATVLVVFGYEDYVAACAASAALYDRGLSNVSARIELPPVREADLQPKAYYIPLTESQVNAIKIEGILVPETMEEVPSLAAVRGLVNQRWSQRLSVERSEATPIDPANNAGQILQ